MNASESQTPPAVSMRQRRNSTGAAWDKFANRFALILIAGTFALSLAHVLMRGHHSDERGKEVLTLAHWQLEPGVRDGLELMARRYNEVRRSKGLPEIVFKQLPISEKGYGQWVTTQFMGGTAPDLVEVGVGLSPGIWTQYRAQFLSPVTQEILKPNPYNAGTNLESVSWKESYIDGMGVPVWELQEYYDIGLSSFGVRLYYNRDLLKKLTGLNQPPGELREFLKVCDRISDQKDEHGDAYVPIAGSKYQMAKIFQQMIEPLTGLMRPDIDDNFDGYAANHETFLAFYEKRASFSDPRLTKAMEISCEIAKRMQSGWNGLNRDDAVQLIIPQRAVFIATGSWDALTLKVQAENSPKPFHLGIAQFPLPSADDPEFKSLAVERPYEKPSMGFAFGITKSCRHPDLALDFMRFITSQKNNQELNDIFGWIPVIRGTQPSEFLKAFQPNFEGVRRGVDLNLGGRTDVVIKQLDPLLQLGQNERGEPFGISDWSARMETDWVAAAASDFEQRLENERDGLRTKEALAATLRAKMILSRGSSNEAYARRHYLGYANGPSDAARFLQNWEQRFKAVQAREAAK